MKMRMAPPRNAWKIARRGKGSMTPGNKKGENCQTDPIKRFFACSPKAQYHPQYEVWNKKFRDMNNGSKLK